MHAGSRICQAASIGWCGSLVSDRADAELGHHVVVLVGQVVAVGEPPPAHEVRSLLRATTAGAMNAVTSLASPPNSGSEAEPCRYREVLDGEPNGPTACRTLWWRTVVVVSCLSWILGPGKMPS